MEPSRSEKCFSMAYFVVFPKISSHENNSEWSRWKDLAEVNSNEKSYHLGCDAMEPHNVNWIKLFEFLSHR